MFSLPPFVPMWSGLRRAIAIAIHGVTGDREFDLVWAVLRDELAPLTGFDYWSRSRHITHLVRLVFIKPLNSIERHLNFSSSFQIGKVFCKSIKHLQFIVFSEAV